MRIAVTGAGGNIGRGLVPRLVASGHDVTASDLLPIDGLPDGVASVRADVRTGEGLEDALAGADVLVHLPAWHGIHAGERTEREFWELNVDGTFHALQAAVDAGTAKAVWLSSQSWHGSREKYGFTKVVGELLLDYHRAQHGLSYVAVRPGNLTPWTDWVGDYGRGLLYGRVDREDVLDAVALSVDWVARNDDALIVDAVAPDAVPQDARDAWEADPIGTVERIFPGARAIVERFDLDVSPTPARPRTSGWAEIGYRPSRDFGSWVREVAEVSDDEARARTSTY